MRDLSVKCNHMSVSYSLQTWALFPASAVAFQQSRRCALFSGAAEPDHKHSVKSTFIIKAKIAILTNQFFQKQKMSLLVLLS